MKRSRKIALKLLTFLVLGAILNVAVAWGFAYFEYVPAYSGRRPRAILGTHPATNPADAISFQRWEDHGTTAIMATRGLLDPERTADAKDINADIARNASGNLIPLPRAIASTVPKDRWGYFFLKGWPMRSMWARWEQRPNPTGKSGMVLIADSSLVLPNALRNNRSVWHFSKLALPTRVLPLGFTINTVFYAGIVWLLFVLPVAIRRRQRIKRSLCVRCAYPLGTSPVCTECGSQRS